MKVEEVSIPLSRARREFSRLIREVSVKPNKVFIITKNNIPYTVLTSEVFYNNTKEI